MRRTGRPSGRLWSASGAARRRITRSGLRPGTRGGASSSRRRRRRTGRTTDTRPSSRPRRRGRRSASSASRPSRSCRRLRRPRRKGRGQRARRLSRTAASCPPAASCNGAPPLPSSLPAARASPLTRSWTCAPQQPPPQEAGAVRQDGQAQEGASARRARRRGRPLRRRGVRHPHPRAAQPQDQPVGGCGPRPGATRCSPCSPPFSRRHPRPRRLRCPALSLCRRGRWRSGLGAAHGDEDYPWPAPVGVSSAGEAHGLFHASPTVNSAAKVCVGAARAA